MHHGELLTNGLGGKLKKKKTKQNKMNELVEVGQTRLV